MSDTTKKFEEKLLGANIAVIGLGVSNVALIRFLNKIGSNKITVYDKFANDNVMKSAAFLKSEAMIQDIVTGENYLDKIEAQKPDFIFKSPVIRPDLPAFKRAVENGAYLSSEMELFFELCPCRIFGVTGSDGKTTTTTLIHMLLSAHFAQSDTKVWLGGNIGTPLIEHLPEIKENDIAVVELSSFQLMTMKKSPDVSVITNITPNHLDVHKNYEEYIEAKKNIYLNQKDTGIVVLNAKNEAVSSIAKECIENGKIVREFSAYYRNKAEFDKGAEGYSYMEDDDIIYISSLYNYRAARSELLVPGMFNADNLCAAISACAGIINEKDILTVLSEFKGVKHRLEFVREIDGVKYYNSSIDSSPNRTIQTLSVFDRNVVLIAGGKDKNIPYDDIGPVIYEKVKVLILVGPTSDKIAASVSEIEKVKGSKVKIFRFNNYPDAVQCAHANALKGDYVLLSPASTSFDLFRNFEERGEVFKSLVNNI